MGSAALVSVNVGRPRRYGAEGATRPIDRPWQSAIEKAPAPGPVWVGRLNLAGDRQADQENHGGPHKAVLAYAARHYPDWRLELGSAHFPYGAFGENLTVAGLEEATVCIGDTLRVGEVHLQVSQPREPCYKLAYRWRIKDRPARVQRSRRPGWYMRVLAEGLLECGQPITLIERPHPEWSVLSAIAAAERRREDTAGALALAACPALAPGWRDWLRAEAQDADARAC